jgi:hypothetical protein
LAVQEKLLQELERTFQERQLPLKLATTRLDKRSVRPNVELVHDAAHIALVNEVSEIERALEQLQQNIDGCKSSIRGLIRAKQLLEEDIAVKTNSINLDNKCMLRRQQYKYRPL